MSDDPPDRPNIPEGIGQAPDFVSSNVSLASHPTAEFSTDTNSFEIKMNIPGPMKIASELTPVSSYSWIIIVVVVLVVVVFEDGPLAMNLSVL